MAPTARGVGDVHYSLAQACEYAASDLEAEDPARSATLRAKSLAHYEGCAAVFQVS